MRAWQLARAGALGAAAIAVLSIHTHSACSQVATAAAHTSPRGPAPATPPGPPPGAGPAKRQKWLRGRIDDIIAAHHALAGARIGICVRDVGTGRSLYEHDADQGFSVASNTKLATMSAGLSELGPQFRFHTDVFASVPLDHHGAVKGDLYIRGRADPSLGTKDLRNLVWNLWVDGLRRVDGGVIVDDTYFDGNNLPPHFGDQPKEDAAFRAPIGAASLNFDMFTLVVVPSPTGSGPARVVVDPPNDYIALDASVLTVHRGRNRIRITMAEKGDNLDVKIVGQIRSDAGSRRFRRRIVRPAQYLGSTFRALLAERGIRVRNRSIRRGAVPQQAVLLGSHESRSLAVIARAMGKYSNNYTAEMLLKTLGAEEEANGDPATWQEGLDTVRGFLTRVVGLEPGHFRYDNGSGLFDASQFSPKQIVAILTHAARDFRYGPDLLASLSIGGTDGTLIHRMGGTVAARLVRAKTGTLDGVSALSGYAAIDGRHRVVFSALVNGVPAGAIYDARALQDDVAEAIVRYLGGGAAAKPAR